MARTQSIADIAHLYLSADGDRYQRNAAYAALARWYWRRQDGDRAERKHLWRADTEELATQIVNGGYDDA